MVGLRILLGGDNLFEVQPEKSEGGVLVLGPPLKKVAGWVWGLGGWMGCRWGADGVRMRRV